MTRMTKITLGGALAGILLLVAAGWAGQKVTVPVMVDHDDDMEAEGSLASARNSADSVQYIGCSVYSFGSTTEQAFCFARNAGGTSASCWTTNPSYVSLAKSLNGDSKLFFSWSGSQCTYMIVENSSKLETKAN